MVREVWTNKLTSWKDNGSQKQLYIVLLNIHGKVYILQSLSYEVMHWVIQRRVIVLVGKPFTLLITTHAFLLQKAHQYNTSNYAYHNAVIPFCTLC